MNAALEVKKLCYIFPDKTGIQDISFQVNRGDIYVLYGGHNSGKTVLLQAIIGTIVPQSGVIKLFGNSEYKQEKIRIGYVPQIPVCVERMTIAETLRYFSLSFGAVSGKFESALSLDMKEKKPVCRLPISIQRFVNLGTALLGNPDFILMDAPFADLDAVESEHLLSVISFLKENKHITFLLTGQDYNLVSRIASKYGILANGKISAELTPAELADKCERCVKIRTPQLSKALPILQKHYPEYEVLADDLIRVFCPCSCSGQINTLLVTAEIEVSEILIAGMESEEYLSKLAGGESVG